MVRHNNIIPNQHFHKKWADSMRGPLSVKTWFNQPAQKKVRRNKRHEKAAAAVPAPLSGSIRPLVQCPTRKYNVKQKLGRGFTLAELKGANINPKLAVTIGISVDHRRTNKSEESYNKNVARLTDFKARLVVFPKRTSNAKYVKNGDSNLADVKEASQLAANLNSVPKRSDSAISVGAITEEMQNYKAFFALREARNEARLAGPRDKKKRAIDAEAAAGK